MNLYARDMFRFLGRAATILALCLAIGLHWLAVQSVAWTSMIVEYSQKTSLPEALAKTFDGKHPCSLCHAVRKGQGSEKKSDFQSVTLKIDLICSARSIRFMPPMMACEYQSLESPVRGRAQSPPLLPPRASLG
jgi:hypothetical protein